MVTRLVETIKHFNFVSVLMQFTQFFLCYQIKRPRGHRNLRGGFGIANSSLFFQLQMAPHHKFFIHVLKPVDCMLISITMINWLLNFVEFDIFVSSEVDLVTFSPLLVRQEIYYQKRNYCTKEVLIF